MSVLSAADTKNLGLSGLVLALKRTDQKKGHAPIAVRIPTSLLNGVFGADYESRLSWKQLAEPTGSAVSASTFESARTVSSTPDMADKATILTPTISATTTLVTAAATPISASGTGSFAATPLKSSSSWDVSAQTGDFAWAYPMRTPPAAAGPAPALALNYDSQSVDGETGSTNNQPSSVGEGWSVAGSGYIERTYVSCSQDDGSSGPVASSGDLCWKTDSATISLDGHSGQLVKDAATGGWRLQSDDGSRLQHLVGPNQGCADNGTYDGDCWRLTTTDGTEYYFGLNKLPGWSAGDETTDSTWTVPVYGNDPGEPCHASTFAASSCSQAWRWNLDYVVDTHHNAEAFFYNTQTNEYSQNGTTPQSYIRGGEIDHIDYGFTDGHAYAAHAASDRVLFAYDAYGRCSDTTHADCTTEPAAGAVPAPTHPTSYPDVPFDQDCISGSCSALVSPTFWSTSMLDTVTTEALVSGTYSKVDVWTLGHSFPDPGDSTNPALWLTQVSHAGYSGTTSLSEPTTTFIGNPMQNRVWAIDGLAPLDKYRISGIRTSLGAAIAVNYSDQECTPQNAAAIEASPQTNTKRCFPQWWTPQVVPAQAAQEDLFHKYVVTSVVSNPETGGEHDQIEETDYVYGTPAWRYDTSPLIPNAQRTWSDFAGYNTVEIRVGDASKPAQQQTTKYTFYQGMDGDRATTSGGVKHVFVDGSTTLPDSLWFAGQTREKKTLNGVGGSVVSDTVNTPTRIATTANDGINTANLTGVADSVVTAPLAAGGTRTMGTTTTYDGTYGYPLKVSTTTPDAGDTCTTNTYTTSNVDKWIVGDIAETVKVAVSCPDLDSAVYPADAVSDVRTYYDGETLGTAPTAGDTTSTSTAAAYSGATVSHWATTTQTYDGLGRPEVRTDALGHSTTRSYTPAATAPAGSGPLTGESTTNTAPYDWATTTTYDPEWGAETSATDPNGKVTIATYDALGRRTAVWLTDRAQASFPNSPSIAYAYTLSNTAANTESTTTLTPSGTTTAYTLYDGLGHQIQTQAPSDGGTGSIVADTLYDSAGRTYLTNAAYWATANASTTLFAPASEADIPSETMNTYDGAGRTTASVLYSMGREKHRTTTAYPGSDRTDTTPPSGGNPTTSYTDALGQQTRLIQYLTATPAAAATQETATYTYTPSGKMASMADAAGNQWTWNYDPLGNQIQAIDPDTGATTSTYDDAGDLLTQTDGRGTTLAYSYDQLSRKTGEYQGSADSSGKLLASWTYDTLAKGQLTSSTSYTGSTAGHPGAAYTKSTTGFDNAYRPTGSTISIPSGAPAFAGTSYSTTYLYDQNGALGAQTDPAEGGLAAERIRYSYDSNGLFAALHGTSTIVDGAAYTGIDQPAEYFRDGSTGLYSNYAYDAGTGQSMGTTDTSVDGSIYKTVASRVYTRDSDGNVTSISTASDTAATDTQCFSYDHLADLTQAWTPANNDCSGAPSLSTTLGGPAPYWSSYTIDPATGNRTSSTEHPTTSGGSTQTDTYTYPQAGAASPHAVQNITHQGASGTTVSNYGYDSAGNTTSRPGQSLTYNATGKLSTVATNAGSESDVYDASGNLLLQTDAVNGSTLHLGDTELRIAHGSTTVIAVRTYATPDGTPLAERTTAAGASGSSLYWLGADPQGTASIEVDASTGDVATRYQDPYGNPRGTSITWSSNHGFLNKTADAFADVTQLGVRAYDATLGTFLSVDSVLAPQNPHQINGYAYSASNPITNSDPSGYCYVAGSDSLNHNTNCVGSRGNPAGPGAAPAPQGGAIGGERKNGSHGVASVDYSPPKAAGNVPAKVGPARTLAATQSSQSHNGVWSSFTNSAEAKSWNGLGDWFGTVGESGARDIAESAVHGIDLYAALTSEDGTQESAEAWATVASDFGFISALSIRATWAIFRSSIEQLRQIGQDSNDVLEDPKITNDGPADEWEEVFDDTIDF